jgi:hypothetical protein
MPGYIAKALQKFQHPPPTQAQHSPHPWIQPQYGAEVQMTEPIDHSAPLTAKDITHLKQVLRTLLFYARAINSSMLVALGSLALAQTKGIKATLQSMKQLLDYAATYPNTKIQYKASKMILMVHINTSYLSEPQARSHAGGYFYLRDGTTDHSPTNKPNGAILVHSTIMKMAVASTTEAEVGAIFYNAQEASTLCNTLHFLDHPQLATPIQTDSKVADGIISNDCIKQRRSKAIDMCFYWVRDCIRQNQFQIHWKKGSTNLADYYTKHHPVTHHKAMQPVYYKDPVKTNTYCIPLIGSGSRLIPWPQWPLCEGVLILGSKPVSHFLNLSLSNPQSPKYTAPT